MGFRQSGMKPQITFTLDEKVRAIKIPGQNEIPSNHKFVVSSVANQTMGVMSQTIRK